MLLKQIKGDSINPLFEKSSTIFGAGLPEVLRKCHSTRPPAKIRRFFLGRYGDRKTHENDRQTGAPRNPLFVHSYLLSENPRCFHHSANDSARRASRRRIRSFAQTVETRSPLAPAARRFAVFLRVLVRYCIRPRPRYFARVLHMLSIPISFKSLSPFANHCHSPSLPLGHARIWERRPALARGAKGRVREGRIGGATTEHASIRARTNR